MAIKGEEGCEINLEFEINRYRPLYTNQINNMDLPYSTGNDIQYLVITYNEKESEKNVIYMYTHTHTHNFAVYLKHCKSNILWPKKLKLKQNKKPLYTN